MESLTKGSGSTKQRIVIFSLQSLLLLSLSIHSAIKQFPNIDEVAHLPSGVSHWTLHHFDMYRVNPPLVRSFAVIGQEYRHADYEWRLFCDQVGQRPEFDIGLHRLRQTKLQCANDFILPKLIVLTFAVFGLYLIFTWTSDVLGLPAGIVASTLWATSPSILAYGPSITPDIGATSAGVFTSYAFWKFGLNPCGRSACVAGFSLGLAMLTKLTWVTGLAVFPFLGVVCNAIYVTSERRPTAIRTCGYLLAIWSVALLIVNAGYRFEGSFRPLGRYDFCSTSLGGSSADLEHPNNRFKTSLLASMPVPFPKNFVLGIDFLKREVEDKKWSFLNGRWKFGSWPHYYVMTTLYKTPEATLLAAVIGFGLLAVSIRRKMVGPDVVSMLLFLIVPAAVCFASVSLQGGFNHHHRYVLMIYPPMFVLAACIAAPLKVIGQNISVPLAVVLVALSVVSSLRMHPHYTSYFNSSCGGPENGWRLMGFSNVDWGQDLLEVDHWIQEHPEARPLAFDLDYFDLNGGLFDLPRALPPMLPTGASVNEARSKVSETQWWIVSVKKLYNLPGHPGLEYLQQVEAVDKIAFAYHVYRIDPLPEKPIAVGDAD